MSIEQGFPANSYGFFSYKAFGLDFLEFVTSLQKSIRF